MRNKTKTMSNSKRRILKLLGIFACLTLFFISLLGMDIEHFLLSTVISMGSLAGVILIVGNSVSRRIGKVTNDSSKVEIE